jgi:hypothetical protein
MKPGDTIERGGQAWAFTGDTSDGLKAVFKPHEPRHQPQRRQPPTKGAEAHWQYSPDFIVCRFPGKVIRPLWWDGSDWRWRQPPAPLPLLNLQVLKAKPDAPVLVVEGEKTAGAATRLFPGCVATTWAGGCKATGKTDWTPLAGRKVTLWPDKDDVGRDAMQAVAALLQKVGAASVKVVANPPDAPAGWDLADADWTPAQAAEWVKANRSVVEVVEAPAKRQPPAPQLAAKADGGRAAAKAVSKARRLSHAKAMACFDRCVEVQAQRERNSLRRRARLLKAAKDLGLASFISRQEIAQRVLEAKARASGERFMPLSAADRAAMPEPILRWLLPGVMPAVDLTILGGRAKVGKTRLAMAAVAAALNGVGLLGMPAPSSPVPVVLVTDDQSDADSFQMLNALDVYLHPALIWSRSFRLTETDLDGLLATVKANPGALVVLDSLRSIGRALEKCENDPEIGAILYDLKAAVTDAGGTMLLIHHCNKTEGLVGTEALSGHNAIAGAANTILTLHYLPGENGRPDKAAPERQLHREARSGDGFDLVITRDGARFRTVMTVARWLEQAKATKLNPLQEEVLDVLGTEWMTRREVCDAVGVEWGDRGRNKDVQKVTRALQALVKAGAAESQRAGVEATYRVPRVISPDDIDDSNATQSCQPVSMSSVSDDIDDIDAGTAETGGMSSLSSTGDDNENPCGDRVASLSSLSSPTWHTRAVELRATGMAWHTIALQLEQELSVRVDGRQVREALK